MSAISEHLFKTLKNDLAKHNILLFPLTGILLTTALSYKSVKIKSQIYLTFKIQNYETHGVFLVVQQLSTSLILSTDWLLEYGVNIYYDKKQIILPSLKDKIPFTIISDHDPNSLINSL